MDDIHEPLLNITQTPPISSGVMTNTLQSIRSAPLPLIVSIILAPVLIIIATRLLSEKPSEKSRGKDGRTVWMPAYWVPGVGHAFSLFWDPMKLMIEARDQSAHGIFSLNIGGSKHNIISNPALVKSVVQQKESGIFSKSASWDLERKFFGLPKKAEQKYLDNWEEMSEQFNYLMKEPYSSTILNNTIRNIENLIPQMVTFMDSEIDQQPWEKYANAEYISNKEMEVNLMSLVRDVLGQASIPSIFGQVFLENNPHALHDIYDMDKGMMYFMAGLPWWTPWPPMARASFARSQVWQSMIKYHEALDALVDDKPLDASWGDMDDVSEFIMKRHEFFRKAGIAPNERADICILWAATVNSTILVYWHLLYILSTPSLANEIISEISPYVTIIPGATIGAFTEAPKLKLSPDDLSTKCPLFKSTYLESLRLCDQPWSINKLTKDITLSATKEETYNLSKDEFVTIPHTLYMQDPAYFPSPTKFNPGRFLTADKQSVDAGTIRPYGEGSSMCQGRVFAEKECLAMVAGILMFWEFEPVGDKEEGEKGKGKWKIPETKMTSAVCLPAVDTRVKIRRRVA